MTDPRRRPAALLLSALLLAGCAATKSGRPTAPSRPTNLPSAPFADPTDTPGNDWASQPFDQPSPVPGYNWAGWADQPSGRCGWLPADLLAPLRPTGVAAPSGHFCVLPLPGGDLLQIDWGSIYTPIQVDPIAFIRPATIAGLQARIFDLKRNQDYYPGSCQAKVNTRSMSGLIVLDWNPDKAPGDREARCAVVSRAADLIVRRMVPAAGGTVWPPTPQWPAPGAVAGKHTCDIVDDIVTTYVTVEGATPERRDTSCTYRQHGIRIDATLTEDRDLDRLDPPRHATVTSRTLGVLPARQEATADSCALAAQLLPGRVLRIEYRDRHDNDHACQAAEVLSSVATSRLLEHS